MLKAKFNAHKIENIELVTDYTFDTNTTTSIIPTKKRVCITCTDDNVLENIYSTLTDPSKGEGVLQGSLECVDRHESVPKIMEFALTDEQITAVKKLSGVERISESNVQRKHRYDKITTTVIPSIAKPGIATLYPEKPARSSFTYGITAAAPHSLYYGQESRLSYIDQTKNLGHSTALSFLNCSNVDIIIWDSGVDATHAEFNNLATGTSQIVQFDWTLLQDNTNQQIVSSIPDNYYTDKEGHGTACASLAAGRTCGFAKNASIYVIKDQDLVAPSDTGFAGNDCLKLVLAFLQAKNANQHGLVSTRPTVINCSWGAVGPSFSKIIQYLDTETRNFASSFGWGFGSAMTPASLPAGDDIIDSYFRQYLDLGANIVVASNDSNAYESNELPTPRIEILSDTNTVFSTSTTELSTTIANDNGGSAKVTIIQYVVYNTSTGQASLDYSIASSYLLNALSQSRVNRFAVSVGGIVYVYVAVGVVDYNYAYGSPNIGITDTSVGGSITYNKNNYPIIKVGDVTPIGNISPNNTASGLYWTANQAYTASWLLSNCEFTSYGLTKSVTSGGKPNNYLTPLSAINFNHNVSYQSARGPFFVKSGYSGFGPDVDVYAPGNATWAAKSNQIPTRAGWSTVDPINNAPVPTISVAANQSYQFFNGTSAATPVVAGILGSILADHPEYTNKQARQFLLQTSLSGGIMSTVPNYRQINFTNTHGNKRKENVPVGIWQEASLTSYPNFTPRIPDYLTFLYYAGKTYSSTNSLTNLLFFGRHFCSNNLIAQAHPLRNIVLDSSDDTVTFAGQTFTKDSYTLQSATSSSLIPTLL
jgi:hypothetical protein